MHLQQWQAQFLQSAVCGDSPATLLSTISPAGQLSAEQGMGVYQNNCLGSRINALASIYTTCVQVLGEDYFHQLAREYARQNTAQSADLNSYGDGFAAFLQQGQAFEAFAYLPDLARLDHALHYLLTVQESAASPPELLAEAEHLVFHCARECQLLSFTYPVDKVWQANQTQTAEEVFEDQPAPYCVVVQRYNQQMRIQRIDPEEYAVLKALNQQSLQGLSERLTEQALSQLPDYLPRWIGAAWLSWERA